VRKNINEYLFRTIRISHHSHYYQKAPFAKIGSGRIQGPLIAEVCFP
jgi:hypothetical protein